MKSFSIAKKVWFIQGVLILGYFISMGTGFYMGLKTENQLQIASEDLFPAAMHSNTAVTAFEKQIKGYNDAILMGEESIFTMTLEKSGEVKSSLQAIIEMPGISHGIKKDVPGTIALLEKFTNAAQSYYGSVSREEAEMDDTQMGVLAEQTKAIKDKLISYKADLTKELKDNLHQIRDASHDQRIMNIWLFLIVVSVSVVFAWAIVTRGVSRPIQQTVAMLQDIAEGEGDLTKRLNISSRDEMGQVAQWFNTFINNLQGIIAEFSQNASQLNRASESLVDISGHMSGEAQGLSVKSNTVAASAKGMSDTLNSVAAAMEETSANTSMVATAAEEMNSTITDIAKNTDQVKQISNGAVGQAKNASSQMKELENSVQAIGMVTEAITDISEQINLLALNATIEAARAGEAGKGFAVVANEIKELARQTATSSADIKAQISTVQQTTGSTVLEIEEITKVITTVNENIDMIAAAVEQQSATTRDIADNIAQASQGIQEVNENVNHSSESAAEISNIVAEVDQSGSEISSSSEQVDLSAKDLKTIADELSSIVSRFKI